MKTILNRLVFIVLIFMTLILIVAGCKKNDALNFGSVADIEGNTYKTIEIGDQIWMAEDLKCTKYSDGTEIELITDNLLWENSKSGAYCWYDNDISNKARYGALYNWYTIDPANGKKVCPDGWHIPDNTEWTKLIRYFDQFVDPGSFIVSELAGDYLKTKGNLQDSKGLWAYPNELATNSSGFSAIPGGLREIVNGEYSGLSTDSNWWSSTENSESLPYSYSLTYANGRVFRDYTGKNLGFNLRCIKD